MRNDTLAIALVVVLVLVASGIFLLQAPSTPYDDGYPKIYIRSDGSVEPSTTPINRNGNLYTLQADIKVYKLIVEKNNMTLDGNSFSIIITSPNGSKGGPGLGSLELNNVQNVTLRNIETNFLDSSSNKIYSRTRLIFESSSFCESLNNQGHSILIRNCHNILVSKNNFSQSLEPTVQITNSRDCTISSCSIYNIALNSSHHNSILNNNMTMLKHVALIIDDSNSNLLFGNQFRLTGQLFKISGYSDKNLLAGNYIQAAVHQDPALICSGVNTFYHNNFFDFYWSKNLTSTQNIWDNGFEGNYWNDYHGTDSNHNGIGDTPHLIDTNNQDRYPLIEPLNLSLEPQPPLPL
jgi:hypothetical protein